MLARLCLLLPAIGAALHLLGFRRTQRLLTRLTPDANDSQPLSPPDESTRAQQLTRLVVIAANHGPYRATCLCQSLALWWLLRRRGIPAELRIGVRKDGGELNAHAWVEHQGRPLNDFGTAVYAPFDPPFTSSARSQP